MGKRIAKARKIKSSSGKTMNQKSPRRKPSKPIDVRIGGGHDWAESNEAYYPVRVDE